MKRSAVHVWESVPGGLWRIEVPGGWIYSTASGGDDRPLCFVPAPVPAGLPAIAARPAIPQPEGACA